MFCVFCVVGEVVVRRRFLERRRWREGIERILQLAANRRVGRRTKTEILYDTQIIDRLKNYPVA